MRGLCSALALGLSASLLAALPACGKDDGDRNRPQDPTHVGLDAGSLPPDAGAGGPADAGAADAGPVPPEGCQTVEGATAGPPGTVPVRAEVVVTGLEVVWGIAFLPNGDMLVTERPGRLRLVRGGALVPAPVATFSVVQGSESGLLGIALHPDFAANRLFYLYYTLQKARPVNRLERWRLSEDGLSATPDRIIVDDIPAASVHDGGRVRFGPDGMLYFTAGDATEPGQAPQLEHPNGKMHRVTPDGAVPADNPFPGSTVFLTGVRNSQGFDWYDADLLYVVDHGPSGEFPNLRGHDEVTVATKGDNLGWPEVVGCQARPGIQMPELVWERALPPGGAALYRGDKIPEWRGSLFVGVLGARHLHRVMFHPANPRAVTGHEVYFLGDPPEGLGRLREVVNGPDGYLYVGTSNCDGRGTCPPSGDAILRIRK